MIGCTHVELISESRQSGVFWESSILAISADIHFTWMSEGHVISTIQNTVFIPLLKFQTTPPLLYIVVNTGPLKTNWSVPSSSCVHTECVEWVSSSQCLARRFFSDVFFCFTKQSGKYISCKFWKYFFRIPHNTPHVLAIDPYLNLKQCLMLEW